MACRSEILSWVNDCFSRSSEPISFSSLAQVPGKAIARLLNGMFGRSVCPLKDIYFDDNTPTLELRNRKVVLTLARNAGYDGYLEAVKWADGEDFANELCFWKWLREAAQQHPIPAGCDLSLRSAAAASSVAVPRLPLATATLSVLNASSHANERHQPGKRPRIDAPDDEQRVAARRRVDASAPAHPPRQGNDDRVADNSTLALTSPASDENKLCGSCRSARDVTVKENEQRLLALEKLRLEMIDACERRDAEALHEVLGSVARIQWIAVGE